MKKEEKERRLRNYEEYWNLVDKLRDISLDALNDEFSVSDMISALDRVKVELLHMRVIVEIEDSQKQSKVEQSEEDDGSEEESEIESGMAPPQAELKVESPFVNLSELEEGMRKGMLNN